MARHKVARRKLDMNLTPLLDLVFQLIVFFLLVTNFSSAQLPDLDPPDPEDSQARTVMDRDRLVINVLPEAGTGAVRSIQVGIRRIEPGDFGELTRLIQDAKDRRGELLEVDLRADASIEYGNMRPIMNAITSAGIGTINLVAFLDQSRPATAAQQ